jgi:hypothetical protein
MYVMYVWDGVYYGFGGVGWGVDCVVLYTVYILWFEMDCYTSFLQYIEIVLLNRNSIACSGE